MLPSLRITATRCLPRYSRMMSTVGSEKDQSIFDQALASVGQSPNPTQPLLAAGTPGASSSNTTIPTIMEIPPAEDPLLHYFTSSVLTHGHRARAARITSNTLLHIHAFTRAPPLPILRKAIEAAAPAVRTLMHKQGGKVLAKPVALGEKQRTRKAVQAILAASKSKIGRTVEERLAREIIAVVQGKSAALDNKEAIHKFAMVNRGNAQTRI
ncbi:hypothetical protein D9615_002074 [Tricholomella constricta]|uniref:Small ribosomal subunit protein uS7 domain-containing protein n=1 Tax=Tricholomella constricta TaxID=117010 RepID=A0A8H5HNP5_9AGAR|nr:hypothetical protein D9615_002074 [Tricholomella constricta]